MYVEGPHLVLRSSLLWRSSLLVGRRWCARYGVSTNPRWWCWLGSWRGLSRRGHLGCGWYGRGGSTSTPSAFVHTLLLREERVAGGTSRALAATSTVVSCRWTYIPIVTRLALQLWGWCWWCRCWGAQSTGRLASGQIGAASSRILHTRSTASACQHRYRAHLSRRRFGAQRHLHSAQISYW